MNNLNSVNISGNLVRDSELKFTNSGMAVGTFSIAVNRKYSGSESVSFVDCKMFGKLAESVHSFMTKGRPVVLSGRLDQERWEGRDGSSRSKLVIVVDFVQLLHDGKESDFDGEGPRTRQNQRYAENGRTTTPSVGKSTGDDSYATGGGESMWGDNFDAEIPF